MKISVKNLKGDNFEVEEDGESKVSDLKIKVGEKLGFEDPLGCKIIYDGSVLDDAATLAADAGMKDGCFVVVMPPRKVKKPAAPAASAAPAAPKEAPAEAPVPPKLADPAPATSTAAPASTPADTTAEATAGAPTPASNTSNALLTGAEYEATIKQIVEMGFDETTTKQAMRAAFNNPDRAVEYLFNGIPEVAEAPAEAAAPAAPTAPGTAAATPAANGEPSASR